MPNLETPDELADHIADLCGVYGACPDVYDDEDVCRGRCRVCFVGAMTDRIRNAAKNELRLAQLTNTEPTP